MEQAHCLPLNVSQGSFNEGQFLDQLLGLIQMPNLKMKYFGWSRYIFRAHNSFTATPLTKEEENTHMNRFASQSTGIATVATLTSLVENITQTTLSPEDKMDLTENQATMVDIADEIQNELVPSNSHRRSVHQTLVQDRDEHIEVDLGDGFYIVCKTNSSGVSTPSIHNTEFPKYSESILINPTTQSSAPPPAPPRQKQRDVIIIIIIIITYMLHIVVIILFLHVLLLRYHC